MEVARQGRRLCIDSAWCAFCVLNQCTHLCIDECTFQGIAEITCMHIAPFFCVDMCVFAFCVCIRVHLCLDMCSVQAGDCVLCTIWSSGSTRLFCNDECVCYLLFFTVCTVCALYFDLCTIWSSSGSGARAASACRIGNSCKKEASATLSLVQIVLNSFT